MRSSSRRLLNLRLLRKLRAARSLPPISEGITRKLRGRPSWCAAAPRSARRLAFRNQRCGDETGRQRLPTLAQVQPETPGRLADHAYAYEAMEWAGYEMLMRFAHHAADEATAGVARSIGAEERTMMDRLEQDFDEAEGVSHANVGPEDMPEHVTKHLVEVHAFENQGIELLEKSKKIGGSRELEGVF